MKLFWKAAFAALLLVGAISFGTTSSHAGAPSHSATVVLTPKAYQAHNCRCRKRHHRRHRAKRKHGYHRRHKRRSAHRRRHKRHGAHRRHARPAHHYSRRAHGQRHRSRQSGYTYHHAGYWYSAVWWVPVLVDNSFSRTLSHAKWCRQQYGIYYDRRSNTYQASDGRTYRCIRPRSW
ncbi:MAG: hypothetical protein GY948_13055 [Alphaproteobacteria bacterium]|nr:hypothetical protein [Alphaproteobacteria bacterium]